MSLFYFCLFTEGTSHAALKTCASGEKAILTDVVSPSNISAKGFLVNQKVKDIFGSFNLMEHRYYPAKLIVKGQQLQYFWLHFKEDRKYFLSKISFEKSEFYIGNLARWKESELEITSIDDYHKIDENKGFKTINIQYLSMEIGLSDLFYVNNLHDGFIVSARMANTLRDVKISGLEITKPDFTID